MDDAFGHHLAQCAYFAAGKMFTFAQPQLTQRNRTNRPTNEAQRWITNGSRHVTNLALFAFTQHNFQPNAFIRPFAQAQIWW
jgi:hypothetical protein